MPISSCKICRKKFYAKPNWLKRGWGKYCSGKCQFKAQLKGKFMYCNICRKKAWKTPLQLKRSKSEKFFCSKSCQTLWRNREFSGPRHPNWTGGEFAGRRILERANKKVVCTHCNAADKRVLMVHHKDGNRKNNRITNLIWLCQNCHPTGPWQESRTAAAGVLIGRKAIQSACVL